MPTLQEVIAQLGNQYPQFNSVYKDATGYNAGTNPGAVQGQPSRLLGQVPQPTPSSPVQPVSTRSPLDDILAQILQQAVANPPPTQQETLHGLGRYKFDEFGQHPFKTALSFLADVTGGFNERYQGRTDPRLEQIRQAQAPGYDLQRTLGQLGLVNAAQGIRQQGAETELAPMLAQAKLARAQADIGESKARQRYYRQQPHLKRMETRTGLELGRQRAENAAERTDVMRQQANTSSGRAAAYIQSLQGKDPASDQVAKILSSLAQAGVDENSLMQLGPVFYQMFGGLGNTNAAPTSKRFIYQNGQLVPAQ